MTAWLFCTSGAAVQKAGTHVNSALALSGTGLLALYNDAEGKIEQETYTAWSDGYSGLPTGIKNQLSNVCSSIIAMNMVAYDPTGYLTREADMLMNNYSTVIAAGMSALADKTKHDLRAV